MQESFWASSPHAVQQFSFLDDPLNKFHACKSRLSASWFLSWQATQKHRTWHRINAPSSTASGHWKSKISWHWGNYFVFILWTQENHFTVSGIALHPWVTWVTTFPGKQRRLDGLLPSSVRRWSWVQQQWSPTNHESVFERNLMKPLDFLAFRYF